MSKEAVTITENDGLVTIDLTAKVSVAIPRDVLDAEFKENVGAMVVERMILDLQLDVEGADPHFVPLIDRALREHLAAKAA